MIILIDIQLTLVKQHFELNKAIYRVKILKYRLVELEIIIDIKNICQLSKSNLGPRYDPAGPLHLINSCYRNCISIYQRYLLNPEIEHSNSV